MISACMKKIIITLDGYSSCGKSTLARQLAKELNYVFIDSGAMYRAITLYFLRKHIDYADTKKVIEALSEISLSFEYNPVTGQSDMYLNDENVESLIREMVVSEHVSEVAALKEVREFGVAQQQLMGKKKGIVMDGRDIGTVVFPDADIKIFMTALPEIRAKRRYDELTSKGAEVNFDEILENVNYRDKSDSGRPMSPLMKADDAIELDNSDMTLGEQMEWFNNVLKKVRDED